MLQKTAFVPIKVDAIFLENDTPCINSRLIFSRLPYFNGERDIHAETPYLGESISANPFEYRPFPLKKGVHLHWALSDALTKRMRHPLIDISKNNILEFPPVPNRWIISRYNRGNTTPEAQWLVESDYLYPEKKGNWDNSIAFPVPLEKGKAPFRFMGRALPFPELTGMDSANDEYLAEPLTALGYGALTFAAFYPNCYSVFGFHDETVNSRDLPNITYEVIGYYDDISIDYLHLFIEDRKNRRGVNAITEQFYDVASELKWLPNIEVPFDTFSTRIRSVLINNKWILPKTIRGINKDYLQLAAFDPSVSIPPRLLLDESSIRTTITNLLSNALPAQMLCFGEIIGVTPPPDKLNNADIDIAIGNTGTEALSAYLANQDFADDLSLADRQRQKRILEEYLESIHLFPQLEHLHVDVGAKFKEMRHEKGFKSSPGGIKWTISESHAADFHGQARERTWDNEHAHLLNQLNLYQEELNQLNRKIIAKKMQLYADWNKYMSSRAVPTELVGQFPDIAEIRFFMEEAGLKAIQQLIDQQTKVENSRNVAKATLEESLFTLQYFKIEDILDWKGLLTASIVDTREVAQKHKDLTTIDKQTLVNRLNRLLETPITQELLDGIAAEVDEPSEEFEEFFRKGAVNFLPKEGLRFIRLLMEGILKGNVIHRSNYSMQIIPDNPFWLPTDPVLLLSGDKLEATDRHNRDGRLHEDGLLECPVFMVDLTNMTTAYQNIHTQIQTFKTETNQHFAFNIGDSNRRHPLLLDWQVAFRPTEDIDSDFRTYSPSYLQAVYELRNNEMDLHVSGVNPNPFQTEEHNYWGTTVLSAHPGRQLKESLDLYLENYLSQDELGTQILNLFFSSRMPEVQAAERTPAFILNDLDKFNIWFLNDTSSPIVKAFAIDSQIPVERMKTLPLETAYATYFPWVKEKLLDGTSKPVPTNRLLNFVMALSAYQELNKTHFLSQSLGGFTKGMLMHRSGYQLDIADPMGFPQDKTFARRVKSAIGNLNHYSIMPENAFFPIRAGTMDLLEIRLIDTFGLEMIYLKDIPEKEAVITSETLQIPNISSNQFHLMLRPRLAQPARLDFRWLAAFDDDVEFNFHPATSPICGWVIINNLDDSLMIYDQSGEALGFLDLKGKWRVFPGHSGLVLPESIPNRELRRMVLWLIKQVETKTLSISDFVGKINNGLDTIEPDANPAHEGVAVLMGRPLALVRAAIGIELSAPPAIHHGWNELRQDLAYSLQADGSYKRVTRGLEKVKFEVRLGEDQQLNDGLVGFWVDSNTPDGQWEHFYAPIHHDDLTHTLDKEAIVKVLKINVNDSNLVRLSLLMDPKGKLHATTGILPVATLEIPPDQYADTLKGLQAFFLTAPLLTPKDALHISMPDEPGYAWSWVSKATNYWQEQSTQGLIQKQDFEVAFKEEGNFLWDILLAHNWLQLVQDNQALIVPKSHQSELDTKSLEKELEEIPDNLTATNDMLQQQEQELQDLEKEIEEKNATLKKLTSPLDLSEKLQISEQLQFLEFRFQGLSQKNKELVAELILQNKKSRLAQEVKLLQTLIQQKPKLEAFLNQHKIKPFQEEVTFLGKQVIREGWLKLRVAEALEDKS